MITIKTPAEIQIMAEGGRILAEIMKELKKEVKPGITTEELNKVARDLVLSCGAKPSFENHMGFPATLCTSVNEVIVHGVPGGIKLKEGDIISLDLGVLYPAPDSPAAKRYGAGNDFHTDMAVTVPVGKISSDAERLIKAAKEALEIGIREVGVGKKFGDIGKAIQNYAKSQKFGLVRELCGHGIGRKLHEDPQILNYVKKGEGEEIMKEGMVFCIEPMLTMGDWQIKKSQDGFGYETKDKSLASHFEHTIALTKKGPQVLTRL